MLHLSGLRRRADHTPDPGQFPWSLPLVRDLTDLELTAPVTFLIGENGSGKSTLLEGMAAGMKAVAAGSRDIARDPTLAAARAFAAGFVFVRRSAPRTRLFVRAEDVFGFTNRVTRDMADLDADRIAMEAGIKGAYGRQIAGAALSGQRRDLATAYGDEPDAHSHGETFLRLLEARLAPGGLYFLDEPETPLSPSRVLALMRIIAARVAVGCQFIIATHSPILMALPGAVILEARDGTIQPVAWETTDHVRVTRAFLNDPASVLRQLLED